MSKLTYKLFKTALSATQARRYRSMMRAAESPRGTQDAVLRRILAANAETEFGREHGLASVASVSDFRQAVPVLTYEDLREAIERQELTGERCLTNEQPVYYHRTSGTVGAPKNIPVTASGLAQMKRDQRLSAYVWARDSGVLEGKVFAISGAAVEGHMDGGTPFGSASGLLYRHQSRFVQSRYVLPAEVSDIEDYDARYLAMAAYGLAEPGVTGAATANPSTFLRLLSVVHDNADAMLGAIASGKLPGAASHLALTPRPERARELERRLSAAGRLTYADIWPGLRGIVTWTGGSCGIALGNLSPLLPDGVQIIEWGYSSSEFRGTLNVDVGRNACLPTFLNTFFEFAERDAWEANTGEFLCLDELEDGREYYVFVTTGDGLYRYDINDIVRVNGWVGNTPTFGFVQKGKGVTNITGEKVTEAQVLNVVTSAFAATGAPPEFFIMLADEAASGYTLYVETPASAFAKGDAANEIDGLLSVSNIEYESKRKSGRLAPLRVRLLPDGAGGRYRESCVASGQRDAQFKYLHLQYVRDCAFDFDAIAVGE
ncbi:MAG: GH3 auxin-responsive promoter family protein [Chloroflexi bacterium]|nr:GH3 auxin-responsive promoter family protein [Chloroflexota bacterium]